MEVLRTHVSPESIAEYFTILAMVLDGIPTSFGWNMDEVGHVDSPDAQADTVYTPPDCSADIVLIAVSRTGKHAILIGCICANRGHPKPMVIILSHAVDLDPMLFGVSDRNCHICHQPNGSLIVDLLNDDWSIYSSRKSLEGGLKVTTMDPQC
jgi:hypothetical protein